MDIYKHIIQSYEKKKKEIEEWISWNIFNMRGPIGSFVCRMTMVMLQIALIPVCIYILYKILYLYGYKVDKERRKKK